MYFGINFSIKFIGFLGKKKVFLEKKNPFVSAKSTTAHIIRDRTSLYPAAHRNESVVDILHGTKVADPLEDPDSDQTKNFVNAENQITESFLKNDGQWQKINKKLTDMWNYDKWSTPERYGNYYFVLRNSGWINRMELIFF